MDVKLKNPQRVAWGKKLAEINRQRREEFKRLKEEKTRAENEKFKKAADEFEAWKKRKETDDDTLTIQSSQEKEEKKSSSKMTVFLPVFALSVIGVGTFWYYREHLEKPERCSERPERPKILSRLEKFKK